MLGLCLLLLAVLATPAAAGEQGSKVEYVGGTVASLSEGLKGRLVTVNDRFLIFEAKDAHYLVPWDGINLIEYGQRVGRRYAMAVILSPLLVLSKTRKHFLTVGFTDEYERQQALVFRVDKNGIRPLLVSLEAKTNLEVDYQDEEARRAGKG